MGSSGSKTWKNHDTQVPASAVAQPKSNTQAQITSKDKAILDLKNARDRLKKYQARLDIEARQLHESAKKLLQAEKRDRARLALKVKKFKEQQIKQADDHLLTVLKMLDTVEWETQQLQVFEGLKAGNSILNAIHKEMTVEAVEELMLETAEAQETANEISRIIGGSLTLEDEDAVLLELAEIERLEAESLALVMPEAPTAAPVETVETDDIAILEAPPRVKSNRSANSPMRSPARSPVRSPLFVSRALYLYASFAASRMGKDGDCEFYSPSCDPGAFWMFFGMSIVLICAAGLMAGLTMGLLSLDMLNMRILELEGSDEQKRQAARVLPILNQHHFLLVTLLLVNAGANEALPIFLNKLVPEAVSIVLSVTCVLLFGEIIPSAVFTGPNQLRIAAGLAPAVKMLMIVACPIAYPVSKFLDWWLGAEHDHAQYKRKELKALITLQRETDAARRSFIEHARNTHNFDNDKSDKNNKNNAFLPEAQPLLTPRAAYAAKHYDSTHDTRLHVDEVTIIHGALDLTSKTVTEVMIPMKQVYMLEYCTKLDENVMADILASGHSRIPIYRDYPANIVGLLLVKRLIVLDPDDERMIGDLSLRKPIVVNPDESCYAILNEFQKGRSHIALVTKDAAQVLKCWQDGVAVPRDVEFVGICTIEDVIEELIQEEIEDESDMYVHDIVDYWKTKSRKARLQAAGRNFVKKKLKVLAERARRTVKNRKAKQPAPVPGATAAAHLDAPIQVKIVSEKEPLFPTK